MDKKLRKEIEKIVNECIHTEIRKYLHIQEGVNFNYEKKLVSYDSSHQRNVDTSVENNPTVDRDLIPGVEVWSIFKRKHGTKGDGNPLVYAMKGEKWKFASNTDKKAIYHQFNKIADKFVKQYPVGTTIIVPSGNQLNNYIAEIIMAKSKNARLVTNVVCKLTVEDVDDIVMEDNSVFRKVYKGKFERAYEQLWRYLRKMEQKRNGDFFRHLIGDRKMRDVLDRTFKKSDDICAEDANVINGENVLIIDDTISRGQTVREICKIINETFNPKSVTVLTLFSKKY